MKYEYLVNGDFLENNIKSCIEKFSDESTGEENKESSDIFLYNWIPNNNGYVVSNQTQYVEGLTYPSQILEITGNADSNAISTPYRGNPWTFINEKNDGIVSSWLGYLIEGNNSKFFSISFTMNENDEVVTTCAARYIIGQAVNNDTAIEAYYSEDSKYNSVSEMHKKGYGLKKLVLKVSNTIPETDIGNGINASIGLKYVFGSSDSDQFPSGDDNSKCIYVLSSGNLKLNKNRIKDIYLVGGGAGGSTGSTIVTKGGHGGNMIKNTDTFDMPNLNISIGKGGKPTKDGNDTIVIINKSTTLNAEGGKVNGSSEGVLIPFNNLYYGGSGGASNGNGYIGGGGGGGGNAGNYGSAYMTGGKKGGGISESLIGGTGGAKGYQAGGGNNSGGTGGAGVSSNYGGGGGGGGGGPSSSSKKGGYGGRGGAGSGTSAGGGGKGGTRSKQKGGGGGGGNGGSNTGGGGGAGGIGTKNKWGSPAYAGYGGSGGSGVVLIVFEEMPEPEPENENDIKDFLQSEADKSGVNIEDADSIVIDDENKRPISLKIGFKINNIEFDEISDSEKSTIKSELVDTFSSKFRTDPENIEITLSPGSVIVDVKVKTEVVDTSTDSLKKIVEENMKNDTLSTVSKVTNNSSIEIDEEYEGMELVEEDDETDYKLIYIIAGVSLLVLIILIIMMMR